MSAHSVGEPQALDPYSGLNVSDWRTSCEDDISWAINDDDPESETGSSSSTIPQQSADYMGHGHRRHADDATLPPPYDRIGIQDYSVNHVRRRGFSGDYGSVSEHHSPTDRYLSSPQSSRGSMTFSSPYIDPHFWPPRRFSHASTGSNALCTQTTGLSLHPSESTVYDYEFDDGSIDFYLQGSPHSPPEETPRGENLSSIHLPEHQASPGHDYDVSAAEPGRGRDSVHTGSAPSADLRCGQSSALEAQTGDYAAQSEELHSPAAPKSHNPEGSAYIPWRIPEPRSSHRRSGRGHDDPYESHTPLSSLSYSRPGEQSNHREHPYYHTRAGFDGHYHCPYRQNGLCHHRPTRLKCNYDKYIDSHIKPYRCRTSECRGLSFSSTACLLRHEREAHGLHGHGDRPHLCWYPDCSRSRAGRGFPRHYNLMDHMRRMHQHVETQSTAAARASQTRAARVGQRRHSVKRGARYEDNE